MNKTLPSEDTFVLLDLDGTVIDSSPGIFRCFRHAMTEMGQPLAPDADLDWIIGPPLRRSFGQLLGDSEKAEKAVALYRELYSESGLFEATIYDGMKAAMTALSDAGHRLFLCTAKARPYAEQLVEYFGVADLLEGVYGSELDGTFDDKGDLIAHILKTQGLSAANGCMVGDRDNDTRSAARNDMKSVGVLWGYGSREELLENGAAAICETPGDLPACIDGVMRG